MKIRTIMMAVIASIAFSSMMTSIFSTQAKEVLFFQTYAGIFSLCSLLAIIGAIRDLGDRLTKQPEQYPEKLEQARQMLIDAHLNQQEKRRDRGPFSDSVYKCPRP